MFLALRKSLGRLQHGGWSARLVLAVSVLLAACGLAVPSALATGPPFQRGDVLLTGSGSVQEFSPSGQVLQTVAGSSGVRSLCFNPNGTRLIVPGVGLFDRSGNLLTSNWASVTGGNCVVDGFGDVYVSGASRATLSTFAKYSLKGDLLQTFSVAPFPPNAFQGLAIHLAPDECSMYWGDWDGVLSTSGQLNVCTNTEEPPVVSGAEADDLRVLPNWEEIVTSDPGASLFDTSGQRVRLYPTTLTQMRWMSLDPDGTSFWMTSIFSCCVVQFDINTGEQLSQWPGQGPIAVYGPPLLGDGNVANMVDSNTAGTAEAFLTRAGYSGQMSSLHLYVDSSSTASHVVVGIYANRNGHPGALQARATITNLRAGSWNYAHVDDVPSLSVTAGQRYWIAVLGPSGADRIRFRDAASGAGSETSSQHNLTALPATWSTGKPWATGNLSANGS